MKEVTKVSIAGIAFTLDKDAHRIIKEYLDKLKNIYANNPDGREIIADIEARIAELILSAQTADKTVEGTLAESIVTQLGFPEDIQEEEVKSLFQRRLYRNPEGQKISGVCSGLGSYFGIDPVWVRLAIFIPLFLGIIFETGVLHNSSISGFFMSLFGCSVLLYILLWIAIPAARTPREKLEMKGEKITAKSINDNMKEGATSATEKNASVWSEIFYVIGRIILICVKVFIFFFAVIFGIVAISLLIASIFIFTGGSLDTMWTSACSMDMVSPTVYLLLILACVLLFIIIVFYVIIRLFSRHKGKNTPLIILIILWLITTIMVGLVTLGNTNNCVNMFNELEEYAKSRTNISYDSDDNENFEEAMDSLGEWQEESKIEVPTQEDLDTHENTENDTTSARQLKSLKIEVVTE